MSCNYRRPGNYMPNPSCAYKNVREPQKYTEKKECKEEISSKQSEKSFPVFCSLAMAYVPTQKFCNTFDLCNALKNGTIFPELCKPFCGKRGGMRS